MGFKPIASCCGHGKYPMTIVEHHCNGAFEILSRNYIPRTRKIYKRDLEGYYYIPEVSNPITSFSDEWPKQFIDSIENHRRNWLMSHLQVSEITSLKIKSWLEFLNEKEEELTEHLKVKRTWDNMK